MATAYWCILVAALLPYIWIGIAKTSGERYDNRDPRGWLARQDSPRVVRGAAAQFNAFEAFAPFAAGVLMAQAAGVDPSRIDQLALGFIAFRVMHGALYLAGNARLRSIAWLGGIACVVALIVSAARNIG